VRGKGYKGITCDMLNSANTDVAESSLISGTTYVQPSVNSLVASSVSPIFVTCSPVRNATNTISTAIGTSVDREGALVIAAAAKRPVHNPTRQLS